MASVPAPRAWCAPLTLLRAAALVGKLPLKEDLSVQPAVRIGDATAADAPTDMVRKTTSGDEVYSLKELLFALQNAHLEHSAYFLACVTQRISPSSSSTSASSSR